MNKIRRIPYWKLLWAFILTTLAFSFIFLISYVITYSVYQQTSRQMNEIQFSIEEMSYLVANKNCTADILVSSSGILDNVGSKIGILETRFGKNDRRVLEQKKLYTQLEIMHYSIVKDLNKVCNKNYITILYFYSNEKEVMEESERMGIILSTFKNLEPEKVMVYSFDFNLNTEEIIGIKEKYKIESAPITLINEKDQVYIKNINELEPYLADIMIILNTNKE